MTAFSPPANVRVFQAEWFGADAGTNANATKTTAAIQEALTSCYDNGGGTVTLTEPGAYYINSTLTIYDNTKFILGSGVFLTQLASVGGMTLLRNSNYASTAVMASGNISIAISGIIGYIMVTVSAAGLGVFAGDYVLVTGDTTNQYNGVHRVRSYSDPTLTFTLNLPATISASAGTILVAKANGNITLEGGCIDYNLLNGNGTVADGLSKMAVIFNKVGNLRIRSQEGRNAAKYVYYLGSCDNYSFDDIFLNSGSDGIHMQGPCWNGRYRGIQGQTGDDLIAFTTTNLNYTQYDLSGGNGDFRNMEITDVQDMRATAHRTILLEANESYGFYGIKIDGVQTQCTGYLAVHMASQDATSGTINDVSIRNVTGQWGKSATAPINVAGPTTSGTLTFGTIVVDGFLPSDPITNLASFSVTGRVTGRSLRIANAVQPPLSLKGLVTINGANVSIEQIVIEKCRGDMDLTNAAANLQFIYLLNGTFKHVIVRDCYLTGTGTTRNSRMVEIYAPATTTRIDIVNSYHDGNSICFAPAAITNVPTVHLTGTIHNGQYVVSTSDSYNLAIDGIEIVAASGGTAFNNGATSKTFGIFARGIKNTGGVALFNYGTTNTFNVTGSDGTVSLKTDTAGHTFNISAGAILRDTQTAAPGLYAKGITTYTLLTA
jgi:hypothetical protein